MTFESVEAIKHANNTEELDFRPQGHNDIRASRVS